MQAAVAQVVAHLIGSEEVTGSTPVISFLNQNKIVRDTIKGRFLKKVSFFCVIFTKVFLKIW